jgi:hypothetical protein
MQVGREPGGKLGQWQRIALLFRDDDRDETSAQIHDVHLQLWDGQGLQLRGLERTWRRKACDEREVVWQVSFPQPASVFVHLLRARGQRIPRELLPTSPPLQGVLRAAVDPSWKLSGGCHAALSVAAGGNDLSLQLHGARLCSWDRKGVVLSGTEFQGYGRRVEDFRQSWFVIFGSDHQHGSGHGLTRGDLHGRFDQQVSRLEMV